MNCTHTQRTTIFVNLKGGKHNTHTSCTHVAALYLIFNDLLIVKIAFPICIWNGPAKVKR